MTIRKRLIISYIGMIFIPIILFILLLSGNFLGMLVSILPSKWANMLQADGNFITFFYNSDIEHHFLQAAVKIEAHPEIATHPDLIKKIEHELRLNTRQSGLIIQKNRQLVYYSKELSTLPTLHSLPKFKKARATYPFYQIYEKYFIGNHKYFVYKHDFTFPDRSPGSFIILWDTTDANRRQRSDILFLYAILTLSIVVANALMTFLVFRSIMKPLNSLKHAAQKIANGELNFNLKSRSKDDFGQLIRAFEDMRCQLHDSITIQIQDDNQRKEMLSGISHDLKTPITAINGYLEGIIDGVANTDEKRAKYTKIISAKIDYLEQLTEELQLFSYLDQHQLVFQFEQVDLHAYFNDCVEELRYDLDEKGIGLELNIPESKPILVYADRDHLRRLIINIVGNSIKYFEPAQLDKKIRFIITESDQIVKIEIADNGPGIKPDELPYVFQQFYRADKSRNPVTGGSGLGLAIAKLIILEHGGSIWAESNYGQGTVITLTLKKVIPK